VISVSIAKKVSMFLFGENLKKRPDCLAEAMFESHNVG